MNNYCENCKKDMNFNSEAKVVCSDCWNETLFSLEIGLYTIKKLYNDIFIQPERLSEKTPNKFHIWAFGKDYKDNLTYGELSKRWNQLHGDLFKLPEDWDSKEFDWALTVKNKCLPEYYKIYGDAIV